MEGLLAGQNGLFFSYGPTNAGKTYTIQGTPENEGILPRSLRAILREVDQRNAIAKEEQSSNLAACSAVYKVEARCFEIYNENIYDLLQPGRPVVHIKEEGGEIVVKGTMVATIRCLNDMEKILMVAQANRQKASTMANQDSSRSHWCFFGGLKPRTFFYNFLKKFSAFSMSG